MLIIENVRIILQNTIVEGHVLVKDGIIAAVGEGPPERPAGAAALDGGSLYLAPGFIDLHNHGRLGANVMDGREAIETVARGQLRHGVTGFLAGTSTRDWEECLESVRIMASCWAEDEAAFSPASERSRCLGVYSEGNFFSMEKRGAHNPKYLREPRKEDIDRLLEAGGASIKILALAPELPGAFDAISRLKTAGVVLSAAHSDASLEETREALNRGVTQATHTFNGMRSLHHQEPGVTGALLFDDRVFCELIADGIHVHPLVLSLVYRIKGPERIVLISDSVGLNGVQDGRYQAGDYTVTVSNGAMRLEDGRLAGSSLSLDGAVYTMSARAGVPLCEAVRMASLNPARILGLEKKKGSIAVGKDADLVLFDDQITVKEVFLGGRRIKAG
ncbi:MAG: N-acetylglucosamine-6-phosphate deacetylase [Treponema sp.]|jgi:N-acetylglucosamine-6-phosphate deacetylase|nr:N-acetylglucosamine-6-phosphate deacetylase [Treponema sp.]